MKTKRAIPRVLILALALLNLAAAHRASGHEKFPLPEGWPTGTNRLNDAALARKLDDVANAKLSIEDSRLWVQSAGKEGRREQSAQLKKIARSLASDPSRNKSAFDALYSLWLFGEDKTFFLENARRHKEEPRLAYYSILILAYEPDASLTNELALIEKSSTNNFVRGAVSRHRYVWHVSENYRQMKDTDIKEKVRYLAHFLGGGNWDFGGDEYEPTSSLKPDVVWAKRELSELSRRKPEEVANAILALDPRPTFHLEPHQELPKDVWERYLHYVLRFVSDETRAKYDALRKSQTGTETKTPRAGETGNR